MLPRYLPLNPYPIICLLILKCQLPETPVIDPSVLMDALLAKGKEIAVFEGKDGRKIAE